MDTSETGPRADRSTRRRPKRRRVSAPRRGERGPIDTGLMRRLSGRGRWLIIAALLGGAGGAAAGFWAWGQQVYLAQSSLVYTPLAEASADLGPLVPADPGGLASPRVASPPSGSEESDAALGIAATLERELRMLQRLSGQSAEHTPRVWAERDSTSTLSLRVLAAGPEAGAAETAVRAVLAAYRSQTALHRELDYHRNRTAAEGELLAARARVAVAKQQLSQVLAQDSSAGASAETRLDRVTQSFDALQTQTESLSQLLEELTSRPSPTLAELAAADPEAAGWLERRDQLARDVGSLGWPWRAPLARDLIGYAALTQRLQARADDTRLLTDARNANDAASRRLSELRAELDQARQQSDRQRQTLDTLRPRVLAQRQAAADLAAAEADAAGKAATLAQLEPGGILRLDDPALPDKQAGLPPVTVGPWRDSRAERAVVAGLLGAGMLPCLLTLGFLTDAKVRRDRAGGLVGSSLPLITAVPVVDPLADRDAGVTDASPGSLVQSIQSIRAVIESRLAAGEFSVALTGVGPGSGTTSSAVGLATSIAQTGSQVLLVDLAWLQKPAGRGDDDQAARAGLGIDGVIEELGYLEDEDREALMLADQEAEVGFGALLAGKSLRRSAVQTRVPGLTVLGAMGRAKTLREQWAGRVSSRWLSKLLEVARRGGYDAVLIDAGSAAGSVEGMLGCAAADAVVVVVSNHQTQSEFQKAVGRLQIVGATVVGTVLNRSGTRRRGSDAATASRPQPAAPGRTTGSGIFAAALESRRVGDESAAGSASGYAPLPHDEPAGPQDRPEHPTADPGTAARDEAEAQPAASPPSDEAKPRALPRVDPDLPPIPAGVDPFDEPPAEAGPTPLRLAPRRRLGADTSPTPTGRQAQDAQPSNDSKPDSDTATETDRDHNAATEDEVLGPLTEAGAARRPALEVHVADDVMDQLVDHAIRTARRPERPPSAEAGEDDAALQHAESEADSSTPR